MTVQTIDTICNLCNSDNIIKYSVIISDVKAIVYIHRKLFLNRYKDNNIIMLP